VTVDVARIQEAICKSMCADVLVHARPDGRLLVETPFTFGDGDAYSIFLEPLPSGGMRITDLGNTFMHLSYTEEVERLNEGTRAKLLERIVMEHGLKNNAGEFLIESSMGDLGANLFRFGQALTRIHDLSYLKRARVESTFYEDLFESLVRIVPAEKIQREYVVPTIAKGDEYPIDYRIAAEPRDVFLFGIPSKDKALLVTIILEHMLRAAVPFESMLVFADQTQIPRPHLARLSNVGDEMVASLAAHEDLARKLRKRIGVA
jgi:hypothetical protein